MALRYKLEFPQGESEHHLCVRSQSPHLLPAYNAPTFLIEAAIMKIHLVATVIFCGLGKLVWSRSLLLARDHGYWDSQNNVWVPFNCNQWGCYDSQHNVWVAFNCNDGGCWDPLNNVWIPAGDQVSQSSFRHRHAIWDLFCGRAAAAATAASHDAI